MTTKLLLLTIYIFFAVLLGIAPIQAQEVSPLQYEVVARLDIPRASEVRWSPDGSRLAIAVWDEIEIWDTQDWALVKTIPDAPVYAVKWNPSGNMLAGVRGGYAESVLIWDATTGMILREMTRNLAPNSRGIRVLHDLSWSPDGNSIATDSAYTDTDLLLIWDLTQEDNPRSLVASSPDMPADDWMNIADLEWSNNGQWLLTAGSDGNFRQRSIIRVWDAATGEAIRTIFPGFQPIWDPDDREFAGLGMNEKNYVIDLWDTETGGVITSFPAHTDGTRAISWNFDMNVIAGVSSLKNNPLMLWDVTTGITYDADSIRTSFAEDIEWRPQSNQLAIADLDSGVLILQFDL